MPVLGYAERFAEFPKAVAKITCELDTLLAFFDFPVEGTTRKDAAKTGAVAA